MRGKSLLGLYFLFPCKADPLQSSPLCNCSCAVIHLAMFQAQVAFSPSIFFLLLLQLSLPVQSALGCGPNKHPYGSKGPDIEDCRILLAHLPSDPITPDPDTTPPFSRSLPFLPRGFLYHGTCAAEYQWYLGRDGYMNSQLPALYSAPPVFEIYELMKHGGEAVIKQCLESERYIGGTVWGKLRGDVGWQIRIEAKAINSPWWMGVLAVLRKSMNGLSGMATYYKDPWGYLLWEV